MQTYVKVSAAVFLLVALAHLFRFFAGWPVVLGAYAVPVWCSVVGFLVAGALAWWGFSLSTKA